LKKNDEGLTAHPALQTCTPRSPSDENGTGRLHLPKCLSPFGRKAGGEESGVKGGDERSRGREREG